MEASKDDTTDDDLVDEEDRNKVFDFIVQKTVNCWFASQLKQFRSNNTGREGNYHVKGGFRKDLHSKCKAPVYADKSNLEAAYEARGNKK